MEMKPDRQRFEKDVEFVARHYRKGAFVPRMRFVAPTLSWWREPKRWAAAALIAVTLAAGAMICYRVLTAEKPAPAPKPILIEEPASEPVVEEPAEEKPAPAVERIEFTDTPVSTVARKVEEVYGVRLGNLPADDPSITISYEGTAADFVDTLNELLGSNITISD